MPKINITSADILAKLPGATKPSVDLTAYVAIVRGLPMLPNGYSEWRQIDNEPGETVKGNKLSLIKAAATIGVRVQVIQLNKQDQFCNVRVQPAAKKRAAKKSSKGNGPVLVISPATPDCDCYPEDQIAA